MRSEKADDGRLYVYVDGAQTDRGEHLVRPEDMYDDRSVDEFRDLTRELVESKDETIRILQDQLQEERGQEACRHDHRAADPGRPRPRAADARAGSTSGA